MTRKFIYFSDIESPTKNSVVWTIMIGDSERQRRFLRVINSYAAVHGAWFEKYQECTLMRLILIEEDVFGRAQSVSIRFRSKQISAADFVKILRNNSLISVEKNLTLSKNARLLHQMFDWQFICKAGREATNTNLPSLPRNNLSQQQKDLCFQLAFSSFLILACYLFAAILEVIEKNILMLS